MSRLPHTDILSSMYTSYMLLEMAVCAGMYEDSRLCWLNALLLCHTVMHTWHIHKALRSVSQAQHSSTAQQPKISMLVPLPNGQLTC